MHDDINYGSVRRVENLYIFTVIPVIVPADDECRLRPFFFSAIPQQNVEA
jgi:hypothetical protein